MPARTKKLITVLEQEGVLTDRPRLLAAEVGVEWGKGAVYLLDALPDLRLFLVDSYEQKNTRFPVHDLLNCLSEWMLPYKERTIWLLMPSVRAAKFVGDGSLDWAFIDAGHDYENVRDDIAAWWPKVRPGGVLAGHDFDRRFRGVQRAVMEAFPGGSKHYGNLWWTKKENE